MVDLSGPATGCKSRTGVPPRTWERSGSSRSATWEFSTSGQSTERPTPIVATRPGSPGTKEPGSACDGRKGVSHAYHSSLGPNRASVTARTARRSVWRRILAPARNAHSRTPGDAMNATRPRPRSRSWTNLAAVLLTLAMAGCAGSSGSSADAGREKPRDEPSATQQSAAEETSVSPTNETAGMYDVGGHKLYMSCAGDGPTTVVFVHGWVNDDGSSPTPTPPECATG